jgi:hypothetical protein
MRYLSWGHVGDVGVAALVKQRADAAQNSVPVRPPPAETLGQAAVTQFGI